MAERRAPMRRNLERYEDTPDKEQPINAEHEALLKWFKTVKFRKSFMGGVDEQDLWEQLRDLNRLYEDSIKTERARYDALLAEYKRSAGAKLASYKKRAAQAEQQCYELEDQLQALRKDNGGEKSDA